MAPTVGYWDIRGLAEPIRYLLSYKDVAFTDKRYDFATEDWANDKYQLDLDFPNLPYFIDGDIRLTQSVAILRHLAKQHHLDGANESEKIRIGLAEQQIVDMRTKLIDISYNDKINELKDDFVQGIPLELKAWSAFLGDHKFLAGDNLSYVDFIAYDTFDFYELFAPSVFKDFPDLKKYMSRIETLKQLQNHFKSPSYKRWPIFSPRAKFGGTGKEPKKA